MNGSGIPPEVLTAQINTLDGDVLPLSKLILSTTKEPIVKFYHNMVDGNLIGFSFATEKKHYTLVNTMMGSYFL